MKTWNERRAAAFLAKAFEDRAEIAGTSDAALARLSALGDAEAARSRETFVRALARAEWSEARIASALAEVDHGPVGRLAVAARERAARALWPAACAVVATYERLDEAWRLIVAGVLLVLAGPFTLAVIALLVWGARAWVDRVQDQQAEREVALVLRGGAKRRRKSRG